MASEDKHLEEEAERAFNEVIKRRVGQPKESQYGSEGQSDSEDEFNAAFEEVAQFSSYTDPGGTKSEKTENNGTSQSANYESLHLSNNSKPTLNNTLELIEAPPLLLSTPSIIEGNKDFQQSFSSDGNSVDKTDVFTYDNLIDQIAINIKSGKDRFKFNGSLVELKEFIKLVLKIDGQWTVGQDTNLNTFRSKCKQLIINYWITTKTLTLNGKKEERIKSKIKELVLVDQLASSQMQSSPNFQDGHQRQTQRTFQATPHTENHSHEFQRIWITIETLQTKVNDCTKII